MKRYKKNNLKEWLEFWLPQFQDVTNVIHRDNDSYTMSCRFGTVDFYPASDRLLIRGSNEWKSKGLAILKKEFDITF